MILRDPDFEAMKDVTRLAWLLNLEPVAKAGDDDELLPPGGAPPA